jgi:hypothetical protein
MNFVNSNSVFQDNLFNLDSYMGVPANLLGVYVGSN